MCMRLCCVVPQFLDTCGRVVGGFLEVVEVSVQWQWGRGHWDMCSCWGDHTTPGYDHDYDYDRAWGAVGCECVSVCVRQRQREGEKVRSERGSECVRVG